MFIVINIIVLWLLLQADKVKGTDKMSLSCMLRIFCICPTSKKILLAMHINKSSTDHASLIKMVGFLPILFFLCIFY